MTDSFTKNFKKWASAACSQWNYPKPSDDYCEYVFNRLTPGLTTLLSQGLSKGIIIECGHQFSLKGLEKGKGPYAWFGKSSKAIPSPHWEYYVQVAEYVRLYELARRNDLKLTFEDDLMDLALYAAGKLIVCCEVKEKAKQLMELCAGLKKYERKVDFTVPDRGNDALRKAKYIVKRKPQYFYLMSLGTKLEFNVQYPDNKAFELKEGLIPFI